MLRNSRCVLKIENPLEQRDMRAGRGSAVPCFQHSRRQKQETIKADLSHSKSNTR